MIFVRRIIGHSMQPFIQPNQIVFGLRKRSVKRGSVVLARYNDTDYIKRVYRVVNNQVMLLGDNHDDSHDVTVDKKAVKGRIIWPRVPQKSCR